MKKELSTRKNKCLQEKCGISPTKMEEFEPIRHNAEYDAAIMAQKLEKEFKKQLKTKKVKREIITPELKKWVAQEKKKDKKVLQKGRKAVSKSSIKKYYEMRKKYQKCSKKNCGVPYPFIDD